MPVINLSTDEREKLKSLINSTYRLYYGEHYAEAGAACERALRDHPDVFDFLYLGGLVDLREARNDAGLAKLARARDLYPAITAFDYTTDLMEAYSRPEPALLWQHRLEEFQKNKLIQNYIISYPKCGRTWIRYVLGSYLLDGRPGDPLEVALLTKHRPGFRTTEFSHDDIPNAKPAAKIVTDKSIYKGKRVLFLVRDPRDAVVSFYFQYSLRGRLWDMGQPKFAGSVSDFIRLDEGGIASLVTFFNIWARNRHLPEQIMFLRYEDLRERPKEHFRKIVKFLGWPLNADALQRAIEIGRFENMQAVEKSNSSGSIRLRPPKSGNPEGFKIRRGKVGGYRDYLSADDLSFIDTYLKDNLDDYYSDYKYDSRSLA